MSEKLVFSVKEAQRLLGIDKNQVYRLITRGNLESIKLGGCRKVTAASLYALVNPAAAGAKP